MKRFIGLFVFIFIGFAHTLVGMKNLTLPELKKQINAASMAIKNGLPTEEEKKNVEAYYNYEKELPDLSQNEKKAVEKIEKVPDKLIEHLSSEDQYKLKNALYSTKQEKSSKGQSSKVDKVASEKKEDPKKPDLVPDKDSESSPKVVKKSLADKTNSDKNQEAVERKDNVPSPKVIQTSSQTTKKQKTSHSVSQNLKDISVEERHKIASEAIKNFKEMPEDEKKLFTEFICKEFLGMSPETMNFLTEENIMKLENEFNNLLKITSKTPENTKIRCLKKMMVEWNNFVKKAREETQRTQSQPFWKKACNEFHKSAMLYSAFISFPIFFLKFLKYGVSLPIPYWLVSNSIFSFLTTNYVALGFGMYMVFYGAYNKYEEGKNTWYGKPTTKLA